MITIESELRASFRMMMRGTGPLPELEPWRYYAKKCRILGRDVSVINEPLWNIIYAAKEIWNDARALERTMMMRAGGIAVLMVGCRLVINQVRDSGASVVPGYIDFLGLVSAVLMTRVVLSMAIKSIPRPWLWDASRGTWSEAFFSWFEMLMLDESRPVVTRVPEIAAADEQRKMLRATELRDGTTRDQERQLVVLEAASALNRNDRVGLARFSATLPLLDLVIAALLSIGFCGVPFVEWILLR